MSIKHPQEAEIVDVPVLIVGGGGAGLTCSMMLAQLGIKSLLVNSLPTTSILPAQGARAESADHGDT